MRAEQRFDAWRSDDEPVATSESAGGTPTIDLAGEALTLLPDKAALLVARRTLLVADAHFGKAASFRRLGVPVPEATTGANLDRLTALVGQWRVRRIVFLGDFLHSSAAFATTTMAAIAQWRARHADLELTLVRGNHDDRAGDPPPALGMVVVDEPLRLGGLALCHHPRAVDGAYVLAGHLHPSVYLSGRVGDRLVLPCFWFGARVAVLPAFGAFTGTHPIRPAPDERVFAVGAGRVVEVPSFGACGAGARPRTRPRRLARA